MKRSKINSLIDRAIEFAGEQNFNLPAFALLAPEAWNKLGAEADEIRTCMLGWDVFENPHTSFDESGLVLLTIRNGHHTDNRFPKPYCEKILIQEEGQYTPMHFHWKKTEDIINRAGGKLVVQLYRATADEQLDRETPVSVSVDGILTSIAAGATITLLPGQSVTLTDHLYHKFWAEGSKVLIGEVSMTNDDKNDNRFLDPMERFPSIEEDEAPRHLLCNEYPQAK